MIPEISPRLQGVADRQILREFHPEDARVQSLIRAIFDRVIHSLVHCFSEDYRTYYAAKKFIATEPPGPPQNSPSPTPSKHNSSPSSSSSHHITPIHSSSSSSSSHHITPIHSSSSSSSSHHITPIHSSSSSSSSHHITPIHSSSSSSSSHHIRSSSLSSQDTHNITPTPPETKTIVNPSGPKEVNPLVLSNETIEKDCVSMLTGEEFQSPVICLGDCRVYEESDDRNGKSWHGGQGPLDDNRYYPDIMVQDILNDPEHKIPNCPLTLAHLKEPFYCVEDGHTYDKTAILDWAKTSDRERGVNDSGKTIYTISTFFALDRNFTQLTLVPHILMFQAVGTSLPSDVKAARMIIKILGKGEGKDGEGVEILPFTPGAVIPEEPHQS